MTRFLSPRLIAPCWLAVWLFLFVLSASKQFAPALIVGLATAFGAAGVFAGLYLFIRGFRLLAWKRCIEDTPLTKIGAAAVGHVKVQGTVSGPYTLLSPIAGSECHYYHAVAWDGRDAQNEDEFEGLATETLFTPFFLQDDTGSLMVDPRGAQLELPPEYDGQVAGNSQLDGASRFLQRHGLSTQGGTTVTEYAIKPGDSLLVLGCLADNQGLGSIATSSRRNGTYLSREAAEMQRQEQLAGLGIITDESPSKTALQVAVDDPPRMVLAAGDGRQPFVLARTNPQRTIDSLATRATVDIWCGPIIALVSLGLLLWWLGAW